MFISFITLASLIVTGNCAPGNFISLGSRSGPTDIFLSTGVSTMASLPTASVFVSTDVFTSFPSSISSIPVSTSVPIGVSTGVSIGVSSSFPVSSSIPVPFHNIFPDGTPEGTGTFDVDFDEDTGSSEAGTSSTFHETEDENSGAFGEVFIDSPNPGSVSSMNLKSNWVLTECDPKSDQPQQVLAYCSKPNDPGCQHIHVDGAENTIIALPTSCGLGPYARVASLGVHPNQDALTGEHANQKPTSESLYLLHFDYNFAAIPASNGPIYMRADVTDMPGYWDSVVDSPPERKRWLKERGLEERWWGTFKNWLSKVNTVSSDQSQSRSFNWQDTWTIFHQEAHCDGPPQFDASLDVSLTGRANLNARYGFYLQGTIVPPAVSAAYLYFSSDAEASATLTLKGQASVTYNSDRATFATFGFPGLSYPGLLTIGPSLVLEGYITGQLSVSGEVTTGLTYKFPSVNYALGKTGDDSIGPNVGPSDPSTGYNYTFDYNVDLAGDISIHAVPTIQLGVSVLGGVLIDANAFIRADLHAGVALNGSVSRAVAPSFCVIPHYGAALEGGVSGNVLYWETSTFTHTFFQKDFTFLDKCFTSTDEAHAQSRRSLSEPRIISASEGTLPEYDTTERKGARFIESQNGKVRREIEAKRATFEEVARTGQNEQLSKRAGSIPQIPGSCSCPEVNGEANTDNDIYSDYPGDDVDDDRVYRRDHGLNANGVHPRADNGSTTASLVHPIVDVTIPGCNIKFSPFAYLGTTVYKFYNLAFPTDETNLSPLFKPYPDRVGDTGPRTYNREHVYEMQLLSGFIGELAKSAELWQNTAKNNPFCSWVTTYISSPSTYATINQGNQKSVVDRLKTCVPSDSNSDPSIGDQMPLLESTANGIKANAFGGKTIRSQKTFKNYAYSKKVFVIRAAAGVISYMNDPFVANQFVTGSNCVKNIWLTWFEEYKKDRFVDAPGRINFVMKDAYEKFIVAKVQNLVPNLVDGIKQMIGYYATSAGGVGNAEEVVVNFGTLDPQTQETIQITANDLTTKILTNWAEGQNLVQLAGRL